ncbi:sulfatase [Chloroflexota bacterium]
MKSKLSRRGFLKLASAFSLMPFLDAMPATGPKRLAQGNDLPNVIIILFDALSAFNLSLYGYPRATSPNLERFAARANVYHAHHSAGNFTTPSTASLFTGTYPWTHRAFTLNSLISAPVTPYNVFRLLEDVYHQAAFTQNIFADTLLYQFESYLYHHQGLDSFSLAGHTFYNHLFNNDAIHGLKSYDQFLFKRAEAHGSLFLSILNDLSIQLPNRIQAQKFNEIHPNGLPRLANTDVYFLFEQIMDGVMGMLDESLVPSFVYLHLLPPHSPYAPTRQFQGMFDDGWTPTPKKRHPLSNRVPDERLNERRQMYDEFIANLDMELGRLLDHMQQIGLLDNSYVIMTSDHGEFFERGVHGHFTRLLFEPVIRVPLLISTPGQSERNDISALTSNVDLLPTLMHIAGLPIPDWSEGQALPGLGGDETPDRSVYVVEAKKNPAYKPLKKATIALLKGQYKLIHYLGYRDYDDEYEFYDLQNDPDELENLYPSHPIARELQVELDQKLQEVNQPFSKNK